MEFCKKKIARKEKAQADAGELCLNLQFVTYFSPLVVPLPQIFQLGLIPILSQNNRKWLEKSQM